MSWIRSNSSEAGDEGRTRDDGEQDERCELCNLRHVGEAGKGGGFTSHDSQLLE